jgi:outer membrane protein assembly factor BamE (lipoprotein component of BamABCDE complex)
MLRLNRTALAILSAGLLGLSGCLIGGDSSVRRDGAYISDDTIRRVEPGKTDASWVLATFGKPTECTQLDSRKELWKYTYTEKTENSGYVFLVFGGHDEKNIAGKVFVEITDGVVTKCWRG